MSIPPTNPTLPVSLFIAARAPTRKEPSCSLNTMDWTFGRSTTMSMMLNLVLGNSEATFCKAGAWANPTAMTISDPLCASFLKNCSRCASCWTSNSRYLMPVSLRNFSVPFQIPSLKDLSNFPPMSKTTAGLNAMAWERPKHMTATVIKAKTIFFIKIS